MELTTLEVNHYEFRPQRTGQLVLASCNLPCVSFIFNKIILDQNNNDGEVAQRVGVYNFWMAISVNHIKAQVCTGWLWVGCSFRLYVETLTVAP